MEKYKSGGSLALKAKKSGRNPGPGSLLTPEQEQEIRQPEINPDEYLNHALKKSVHSGINSRSKTDIRYKTQSFMRKLQHNADRVMAFFSHPKLAYQF